MGKMAFCPTVWANYGMAGVIRQTELSQHHQQRNANKNNEDDEATQAQGRHRQLKNQPQPK
jgi:hypothetical protein